MKIDDLCLMIYNIQRFSTHDGEGIRTIIFYKGCPLRCLWCSNPESQSFEPEILFDKRFCRNFGDCLKADPDAIKKSSNGTTIDHALIKDAEKLGGVCISKAITVAGEKKSVAELLYEIEKDVPFYHRSQGGVTLSGGEPLSEGPDLEKLLQELKNRNIDTALETSLYVSWPYVERTLGLVSTYLVDLKHTRKDLFTKYTGGELDVVLKNLERLSSKDEKIIIRVPVIPQFNHTKSEMKDIIDYVITLRNIREIHFIPYHTLGTAKYEMLGRNYLFGNHPSVGHQELSEYVNYAESKGLKTRTGG